MSKKTSITDKLHSMALSAFKDPAFWIAIAAYYIAMSFHIGEKLAGGL